MTGSLFIHHTGAAVEVFTPSLEVLKSGVADKAAALVASSVFDITDAASMAHANDLATVMHATEKEIEARRLFLKRPLTDTAKAIEAVVDGVAGPLSAARKSLIAKIAAWDRKQKDAALAAQREAERKTEEERAAKQKIADEEHAAKVKAEKERAEKEAKELEAILGTPVVAAPVAVAPAPIVAPVKPAAVAAPVAPSAVTTRLVPELVIDETHPALAAFKVGGEMLVTVNRAAVKRVLDAGGSLPWAHIKMVEQVAMKAVRP